MNRLKLFSGFYIFTHLVICTLCDDSAGATLIFKPNNAAADAQVLRAAMKGWGTIEADLIKILASRTGKQRANITAVYKQTIKRDLIQDIKDDTGSDFEDILVDLCYSVEEYLAREINWALKRNKMDYIDIICTSTGNELTDIKEAYFRVYKVSLSSDIERKVTYVPTRMLLLRIIAGFDLPYRTIAAEFDEKEVKNYKNNIPSKEGDCGVETKVGGEFFTMMSKASFRSIQAVVKDYDGQKVKDKDTDKVATFTGRIQQFCKDKSLIRAYTTIASFSEDSGKYFAAVLKDSMNGLGTNERLLNRVIIWRCEIDLLNIQAAFFDLTQQSLIKWVEGDTSSDYEKTLVTLIKGNRGV